jgi:hypothetical protein
MVDMPHTKHHIISKNGHQKSQTEKRPDFENDPVFLRKKEEAVKALTEAPLPDFILERIEGPSILKKNNPL